MSPECIERAIEELDGVVQRWSNDTNRPIDQARRILRELVAEVEQERERAVQALNDTRIHNNKLKADARRYRKLREFCLRSKFVEIAVSLKHSEYWSVRSPSNPEVEGCSTLDAAVDALPEVDREA